MTLSEATQCFQTYLEGHRRDPDDEQLFEDLCRARAVVEALWIRDLYDEEAAG